MKSGPLHTYGNWRGPRPVPHDESLLRINNYLYSLDEFEPGCAGENRFPADQDLYVVTNNHFFGKAVVNRI